ncbi:hypothetical protein NST23_09250 [Brevibacillus sp. FSL K6-0770]|uniref:hypothetical protein n=1 Tax=Brevibacillus sp. FSL K6-0770 TaxID=2954673 RepID=UPI0030F97987
MPARATMPTVCRTEDATANASWQAAAATKPSTDGANAIPKTVWRPWSADVSLSAIYGSGANDAAISGDGHDAIRTATTNATNDAADDATNAIPYAALSDAHAVSTVTATASAKTAASAVTCMPRTSGIIVFIM